MIHIRNFAHAVAIGVMVFMGAAPASANAILRDLDRSGMVQGDVNIMMRSASSLYSEGRGKVGDEVSWKNPNTRADGVVRIISVEGACVTLAHRFRPKGAEPARGLRTKRCLMDGIWVLSAP